MKGEFITLETAKKLHKRKLPFYVEDEETVNKIIDLILILNNEDLCKLLDYFDAILEKKINNEE